MRNTKRRGGTGVDAVFGAEEFAVGSARSRAAARLLAEQQERDAVRIQAAQRVKDPWHDPGARLEVMEEEDPETGEGTIHLLCIPKGMSAADVMGRVRDPEVSGFGSGESAGK